MATHGRRWRALRDYLSVECRAKGLGLDEFDPDFILVTIQKWLDIEDCAITGEAVRPFRRRGTPRSLAAPSAARRTKKGTRGRHT